MLIIAIIVGYIIHRKRLPSFSGTIHFQYQGKDISKPIDLAPWKKQKRIPLHTFAGTISVLLTGNQWDEFENLELRPSKEKGFKLYPSKASDSLEMPYKMASGDLTIVQSGQTQLHTIEEKPSERERRIRTLFLFHIMMFGYT